MSAIHTKCPHCGGTYLAGVVGTWAWPGHVCSTRDMSYHDCYVARQKRKPIFRFWYWVETRRIRKRQR